MHRIIEGQLHSLRRALSFLRSIRPLHSCDTDDNDLTDHYAISPGMYVLSFRVQVLEVAGGTHNISNS